MDADEVIGIEAPLELGQRFAHYGFPGGSHDRRTVVVCANLHDVFDGYHHTAPASGRENSPEKPAAGERRGARFRVRLWRTERFEQTMQRARRASLRDSIQPAPDRRAHSAFGVWFEHIVDCRELERAHRVRVVRGHKDSRRHRVRTNAAYSLEKRRMPAPE